MTGLNKLSNSPPPPYLTYLNVKSAVEPRTSAGPNPTLTVSYLQRPLPGLREELTLYPSSEVRLLYSDVHTF